VWKPHHTSQIATIEKVQKFALRMCYKDWREQYVSLLERSGIQSLADRRKLLDICYLYQLLTGVFNFPDAPLMHRNLDSRLRSFDPQLLCLPFARTTAYMNSFFPRVISFWNSLPSSLHSTASFSEFKHSVLCLAMSCLLLLVIGLLYMCTYLSIIFVLYVVVNCYWVHFLLALLCYSCALAVMC
jgi:hypothetical protein